MKRKLPIVDKNKRFARLLSALLLCCLAAPVLGRGKKDTPPPYEAPAQAPVDDVPETSVPEPESVETLVIEDPGRSIVLETSEFSEIWGYLIAGEEDALSPDLPITDVCYFDAQVDSYGELVSVPNRAKISSFKGRVHLVVRCDSTGVTHFILDPSSPARDKLIKQLLQATEKFDGLQIDFENVPARDGAHFLSFLKELQQKLPKQKWFTIALKARINVIRNDVYDYAKIAPLVDRILIMAYDEHWLTSAPGPIASMEWCRKIAVHAKSQIPEKKLIMGLPFYGATWGSERTSRWFFHSGIERIMGENNVRTIQRDEGVPFFSYTIPVTVTAYFEDTVSLALRLALYSGLGIPKVGFWRLGQEDPGVWQFIRKK